MKYSKIAATLMLLALTTLVLVGCGVKADSPNPAVDSPAKQNRPNARPPTTGPALTSLNVVGQGRAMYPAFDPDIFHYAVGCETDKPVDVSAAWRNTSEVIVQGQAMTDDSSPLTLRGIHERSNIVVRVGSLDYTIHCIDEGFPAIEVTRTDAAWDGLVITAIALGPRGGNNTYHVFLDGNGVPWHWERVKGNRGLFRYHRGDVFPYSRVAAPAVRTPGVDRGIEHIIFDHDMREVKRVHAVDLLHTDDHDFYIGSRGQYVLISYTEEPGNPIGDRPDARGLVLDDVPAVTHSIVQKVSPEGELRFQWSSWDRVNLDNCVYRKVQKNGHNDYAHVNSVTLQEDGNLLLSLRQCMVMLIDGDTGKTLWRVGVNHLDDDAWTEAGFDPPLKIIGDPNGTFCAQHSAQFTPEGNLLVYDNGSWCGPGDDSPSRVAEYAIDPEAGTATFVREHSLGQFTPFRGTVDQMPNGNWLIGWGTTSEPRKKAYITEVNPDTGEEVMRFTLTNPDGEDIAGPRAYAVEKDLAERLK